GPHMLTLCDAIVNLEQLLITHIHMTSRCITHGEDIAHVRFVRYLIRAMRTAVHHHYDRYVTVVDHVVAPLMTIINCTHVDEWIRMESCSLIVHATHSDHLREFIENDCGRMMLKQERPSHLLLLLSSFYDRIINTAQHTDRLVDSTNRVRVVIDKYLKPLLKSIRLTFDSSTLSAHRGDDDQAVHRPPFVIQHINHHVNQSLSNHIDLMYAVVRVIDSVSAMVGSLSVDFDDALRTISDQMLRLFHYYFVHYRNDRQHNPLF
ncbi:hypothetical protein AKO1_005202, partial [Acrasis kona]